MSNGKLFSELLTNITNNDKRPSHPFRNIRKIMFLCLLTLLVITVGIYQSTNFHYVYPKNHKIDVAFKEDLIEHGTATALINGKEVNVTLDFEGNCWIDQFISQEIVNEKKSEEVTEDLSVHFNFKDFEGYFKTIDEAISFGNANVLSVSREMKKHLDIYDRELIDNGYVGYGIQQVCNEHFAGYLVSFGAVSMYMDYGFPTYTNKTYYDAEQYVLKNDPVSKKFKVHVASEIYEGKVKMYSEK